MRSFLIHNWFLCLLAIVLALGFLQPASFQFVPRLVPEAWVVALVLFLMALPLDWSSVWQAMRRPTAVSLAVAINYLMVPLLAWAASGMLQRELAQGLIIAASIPTTLASCSVLTRRAGGNDAVAVLTTIVTNLLCFLVTPAWLAIVDVTGGDAIEIDPVAMAKKLWLLVVLPIVVAQLFRLLGPLGRLATQAKIPLGVLAQLGLLTMIWIGAITAGAELARNEVHIRAEQWIAMFALVVGIHLLALGCGHWWGRALKLTRQDCIAVGFAGSQKTLMVGLHIAISTPVIGRMAILPVIAYHVSQLLIDTLIANRLRLRTPSEPPGNDQAPPD